MNKLTNSPVFEYVSQVDHVEGSEELGSSKHVSDPRINLYSPTAMPNSCSFLWNKTMMLQVNCLGYATGQFMQPEPAKYSHAPNIEAKTFIQPEHPYYNDHPGRFFYLKDEVSGETFSLPYKPMAKPVDKFVFSVGKADIQWQITVMNLQVTIIVALPTDKTTEMWSIEIVNLSNTKRNISCYPCFSIGYMSWMNQSADFHPSLNAIVAQSITPYQKVEDYFKNQELKDLTYLVTRKSPDAWLCSKKEFVGQHGMYAPESLMSELLTNKSACYETPIAVMQHKIELASGETYSNEYLFGPAKDLDEVKTIRSHYFDIENHSDAGASNNAFETQVQDAIEYQDRAEGCIKVESPDSDFDTFVNHWLPRQMFYHGDVNRLSTDPQTRNYVQDAMAMVFIDPSVTRSRILFALSQQHINGAMPDGILLNETAQLKYINQVPHADHCVWLPICIKLYIDETNDTSILTETLGFKDSNKVCTVIEHINLAFDWLKTNTDNRGLSFIEQGDWCDPMNMVGHKGKGVSAWLSFATSYAVKSWLTVIKERTVYEDAIEKEADDKFITPDEITKLEQFYNEINHAANQHYWDGDWYARGITDNNVTFGVQNDSEGAIYLNPQSWAILSGAATENKIEKILTSINQHLATPHGVTMLAPSYTKMRDDVGRLTQKSPGVAENGSVYNHASIFYAYSLFQINRSEMAFDVLKRMIPANTEAHLHGQLPSYLPNYYRGAFYQHPEHAGRSSQLFNTGTVGWFYRCVVEELCGLKGDNGSLLIQPQLPKEWPSIKVTRRFKGAIFKISIVQTDKVTSQETVCDQVLLKNNKVDNIVSGHTYTINVKLPKGEVAKPPSLTIIMGVSGSGKSTIGKALVNQSEGVDRAIFVDADDLHSLHAKRKMASGVGLTDAERAPWLERLTSHLQMLKANDQSVVLAYSGLKLAHRNLFRNLGFNTQFIHLNVSKASLLSRLNKRREHFVGSEILPSQLDAFESPTPHETDILQINLGAEDYPVSDLVNDIKQALLKSTDTKKESSIA